MTARLSVNGVDGGEPLIGEDPVSKERLRRQLEREVRTLAQIDACKAAKWFIQVTWPVFLFQTIFAAVNVYLNTRYEWNVHNNLLELKAGYRPFLLGTLQLITAFLSGLSLNDSVGRFKIAMTAMLELKNSVEGLRANLLASTIDPKFEVSVQVFITMMVVLIQKDVAYFMEDFSRPIREAVPEAFRQSVLFRPEVLWSFSREHWEFMFYDFLTNAQLRDPYKHVKNLCQDTIRCWKTVEQMITTKVPKTRTIITRVVVQVFFIVMPLFNEDVVTQLMVPLVSCIFVGMLQLAAELGDPWGNAVHTVPFRSAMQYLAMPAETDSAAHEINASIEWLNNGLSHGSWKTSLEPPIPRIKDVYPNKGETIDFDGAITLPRVVKKKNWDAFVKKMNDDMDGAASRGRRMPAYLRASNE